LDADEHTQLKISSSTIRQANEAHANLLSAW
jgi:hypothetical protein